MSFGATAPPTVLEGDYSTWALEWIQNYDATEYFNKLILRADESLDLLFMLDIWRGLIYTRKLSDGTSYTKTTIITPGESIPHTQASILSKYFAYILNNAGKPNLLIYKDGALKQTIDLSLAPFSWTSIATYNYAVSISHNGKYIQLENSVAGQIALLKGS